MNKSSLNAYTKGVLGEQTALRHLCGLGMVPLDRRYRSPVGEIDLVLLDGEALVFAEVKTREKSTALMAQYAVTPDKQRRMIGTVRYYLSDHPEHARRVIRFDVVTVAKDGVYHIPNAFEGSAW